MSQREMSEEEKSKLVESDLASIFKQSDELAEKLGRSRPEVLMAAVFRELIIANQRLEKLVENTIRHRSS